MRREAVGMPEGGQAECRLRVDSSRRDPKLPVGQRTRGGRLATRCSKPVIESRCSAPWAMTPCVGMTVAVAVAAQVH